MDPIEAVTQAARERAERPRTSRTTTAIRFPAELHDALAAAANERDLSMNYLVVKAVEDFLPRLVPVDEFRLTR